jgi:hypothetical protein
MAYHRLDEPSVVYFHAELPRGEIDVSVRLTASEARALAASLINAAEAIESATG